MKEPFQYSKEIIKCAMCEFSGNRHTMTEHLRHVHEISTEDYLLQCYGIPHTKVHHKKITLSDINLILRLRENYPQFSTDLEIFQYLYDNSENYDTLNKEYNHGMGKICTALGITRKYIFTEERKSNISKSLTGKKMSEERRENMKGRPVSQETRKKMSASNIGRIVTQETRIKLSKAQKGRKKSDQERKNISAASKGKPKSESHRKAIQAASDREDKVWRSWVNGNNRRGKPQPLGWAKNNKIFNNHWGKSGIRQDIGHYVRSHWEANYARILNLLNIKYTYEEHCFTMTKDNGDVISYTPDFYLIDSKTFVEIKGKWKDDGLEKFNLFKEQHPDIKIVVIKGKQYTRLIKHYRKLINYNQFP